MASFVVIFPTAAEEVTDTAECRSFLARIAQAALDDAIAAAPVYSGEYQASLFAKASDDDRAKPQAILGSSSSFWHFVEYGALETPPYHILGNAVAGNVTRYVDLPKGGD
jgi:Bacteriophage HK97-gp10, putative tail-component